jgi:hypothetical protein
MFHSLKNLVLSMALAVTLCGVTAFGQPPTSTAQSAMFNNTAAGTFVISGTEVWSYNKVTATTYFSNTQTSGPVVTCAGNATNCSASNQPATPAAPAPNPAKLTPFVSSNSCNFWDGTALSLNPLPADNQYKQSVTINGVNGSGNWKFEWTYTIAFTDSVGGPYAAKTAWDLVSSSSTSAEVGVDGFFAGQSTQKKAKAAPGNPWTFKASHTMTADDGSSRLVNPQYSIVDSGLNLVCGPTAIGVYPIERGVDYFYAQNAGFNGSASQLIDNYNVSVIQNGSPALSPGGDADNFAGNNLTNGERQSVDPLTTSTCSISAAGSYFLKVTGTLKGVSGTASLPVAVTSTVCISAGTCSLCP